MEQAIVDFIQKVARETNETPSMTIFGPWDLQLDDSQRELVSAELAKVGLQTIRLSEHSDLYTRVDLDPEYIESRRNDAADVYEEELREWETAIAVAHERQPKAICAIIFDSPVPPPGYTVVQEGEE